MSRGQTSSKVWFTFKAGTITASVMKFVIQTNPAMPSQSLIILTKICYPEAFKSYKVILMFYISFMFIDAACACTAAYIHACMYTWIRTINNTCYRVISLHIIFID